MQCEGTKPKRRVCGGNYKGQVHQLYPLKCAKLLDLTQYGHTIDVNTAEAEIYSKHSSNFSKTRRLHTQRQSSTLATNFFSVSPAPFIHTHISNSDQTEIYTPEFQPEPNPQGYHIARTSTKRIKMSNKWTLQTFKLVAKKCRLPFLTNYSLCHQQTERKSLLYSMCRDQPKQAMNASGSVFRLYILQCQLKISCQKGTVLTRFRVSILETS